MVSETEQAAEHQEIFEKGIRLLREVINDLEIQTEFVFRLEAYRQGRKLLKLLEKHDLDRELDRCG